MKQNKKGIRKNKKENVKSEVPAFIEDSLLGAEREKCKICNDPKLRITVMDLYASGVTVWKIRDELRNRFNIGIAVPTIEEHINNHEKGLAPWLGLVKYQFHSEEERKKFEQAFLSRVSFVTELWDKYCILNQLFEMVAGTKDNINPSAVSRPKMVAELGGQLKDYLLELIKLQRERDIVVEVAKVVLFMMADNFVKKLAGLISDLSVEKREIIGKLLQEEVKNALEYAKSFGKEKLEVMFAKVKEDYEKLVRK